MGKLANEEKKTTSSFSPDLILWVTSCCSLYKKKKKNYNQRSHCMLASGLKPIILNSCFNNECKYFPLESSEDTVLTKQPITPQLNQSAVKTILMRQQSPKMFLLVCSSCFLNCPLLARLSATRTSEALCLVPLGERLQRPVSLMKPDKCAPRLCRRRMQDGMTAVTVAPAECKCIGLCNYYFFLPVT